MSKMKNREMLNNALKLLEYERKMKDLISKTGKKLKYICKMSRNRKMMKRFLVNSIGRHDLLAIVVFYFSLVLMIDIFTDESVTKDERKKKADEILNL